MNQNEIKPHPRPLSKRRALKKEGTEKVPIFKD